MTPLRLDPAAPGSRVKHSTAEPLCSRPFTSTISVEPESARRFVVANLAALQQTTNVDDVKPLDYCFNYLPASGEIPSPAEDLCKKFGPRSGPTERRA